MQLLLVWAVIAAALAGVLWTAGAPLAVVAYPLIGLECMAVGVWTWDRRPGNPTGLLLGWLGLTILAAAAGNTGSPVLHVTGIIAAETPIALLLHLMLAFPGGRLPTRADRLLVATGYLLTVVPPLVTLAVADAAPGPSSGPHAGFVLAADHVQSAVAAVTIALAAWSMARHTARARVVTGERRAMTIVYAYGGLVLVYLPVCAHLAPLIGLSDLQRFTAQIAALAGVPVVFAIALFGGGFARTGELQELASWLAGRDDDGPPLRDALARVLGDPSLELLFTDSRTGALLDAHGRPTTAAGDDDEPTRARVVIPGRDGALAVVVHDRRLITDRALVESAGQMVALALERQRLSAELLAGRELLRSSRARVVEVGDAERRRFAQDLHDLLQGRLVLAAVHARRLVSTASGPATREAARSLSRELDVAVTELRVQLHGVMPAPLLERGLLAALEDLADRSPLPALLEVPPDLPELPPAVATSAYFVAAEAVANAVRHSHATQVRIRVRSEAGALRVEVADDGIGGPLERGAGMLGMADRAEALDGRLEVESVPGSGTRIVAWLPCGS